MADSTPKTPLTPAEQESLFNRRFLAYFAFFLTAAGMAYVVGITFGNVPKDNAQYANIVLGFIMGTVIGVPVGYFYQSSKSNQAKDATIKGLAEAAAGNTAPPVAGALKEALTPLVDALKPADTATPPATDSSTTEGKAP